MDISKRKIIIATHELVYGAPQALRDYLEMEGFDQVTFISHPLLDMNSASYVEIKNKGLERKRRVATEQLRVQALNYLAHGIRSILWGFLHGGRADLYVGANPLNAMAGLILKALGRVDKVIYYTIDFTPMRFDSPLLNWLYHALDRQCVIRSDEVWNVSPQIAIGREKLHGAEAFPGDRQRVVPIGVWFNKVRRLPHDQVKPYQLLFLGHLLEKQGVQLVIEAIPIIVRSVPDFQFLIVGGGEYETTLRQAVIDKCVTEHVKFMGWIKDREVVDNLMADSMAAIATYRHDMASFTTYADPTKLKDYLSAGLPIIMTDVPSNARELEARGCAVIVDADKDSIARAVVELMTNQRVLKSMHASAVKYIEEFDWAKLFARNLSRVLM
ncbi:MAG: glycosyltransferase family 4 protein [Alphaproteobacteria bacterium]|nr:glycosyltransferase family 4 protein [Alphaproteobacteria bacterium]